jgi:hypothetical protein
MADKDTRGEKAEALVRLLLSSQAVSFRVQLIGGKWPTIDIYAEIDDPLYPGMFCFFQVKSTILGRNSKGKLQVKVAKDSLNKLCAYYGPTYLVGVEYNEQQAWQSNAFIMHVKGRNLTGISSMPVTNQLNHQTGATLLTLRDEVVRFWQSTNIAATRLTFTSSL